MDFRKTFYNKNHFNVNFYFQGGGGEAGEAAGDDDMDENLMAEDVDNTLHFKGFEKAYYIQFNF